MAIEILEAGNADEKTEQDQAVFIANALNKFYPNHPWIVSFQSRALIIRHITIGQAVYRAIGRDGFGAVLPPGMRTPKELTRAAIEFGGRLLETFSLPRGAWDGRDPVVPAGWLRHKHKDFH